MEAPRRKLAQLSCFDTIVASNAMKTVLRLVSALLLWIVPPAQADNTYMIRPLMELLKASQPSLAAQHLKALNVDQARAVDYLCGAWNAYQSLASHDKYVASKETSTGLQLDPEKIPFDIGDLNKDLIAFYSDYSHLSAERAGDFLQAFFLDRYGVGERAKERSRELLFQLRKSACRFYSSGFGKGKSFANWFERCQNSPGATARSINPASISLMS